MNKPAATPLELVKKYLQKAKEDKKEAQREYEENDSRESMYEIDNLEEVIVWLKSLHADLKKMEAKK